MRTPVQSDKDFPKAPQGWAVARCFAVIDLGTQKNRFDGSEKHLMCLGFELGTKMRDDGKPHIVYKRYTLSHHKKSMLRKDLEGWYGMSFDTEQLNNAGGFDLGKLMNRPAFLNIVHEAGKEGDTFVNITAIAKLPDGMDSPMLVTPKIMFDLDKFDSNVFESLGKGFKKTIMQSGEYLVMTGQIPDPRSRGASKSGAPNDDVPYGNSSDDTPYGNPGASQPSGATKRGTIDELNDDIPF